MQFTLPLFHEAARTDNKASLQIAAGDQFPDEQSRHDGFSGARIVGEQKTKRLPGQHGFVDRRDLVGERVHARRMHREHRVEQVGKANALRFGYEAEQRPVAIETPGAAPFDRINFRFVLAKQESAVHPAGRVPVGERQGFGAVWFHLHHSNRLAGENPVNGNAGPDIFQLHDNNGPAKPDSTPSACS